MQKLKTSLRSEMKELISLHSISKYRSELMGFAIIGVLIGHIIEFAELDLPILNEICHGIHTHGFLFLSGFGIWYSISRNDDTKEFYVRRFWRFYLPFVLISIPFLFRTLLTGKFDIVRVLEQLSTVNFWINGNTDGMWYIAISFALYLITPPVYHSISATYKIATLGLISAGVLMIIVNCIISTFLPDYWNLVSIALRFTPFYFLGMLVAHIGNDCPKSDKQIGLLCLICLIIYHTVWALNIDIIYISPLLSLVLASSIICVLLAFLEAHHRCYTSSILRWFGKYTLELYILHIFLDGFLQSPMFGFNHAKAIIFSVILSIALCMPVQYINNKIILLIKR